MLNKHCDDLTVDQLILQSQVLVLQETMTLSTDSFNIPGHTLIGKIDGKLGPLVLVHTFIPVIQRCVNFYLHIHAVVIML